MCFICLFLLIASALYGAFELIRHFYGRVIDYAKQTKQRIFGRQRAFRGDGDHDSIPK